MIVTINISRSELIAILKTRIENKFDLRFNNIFADYNDQSGRLNWKFPFNKKTDEELLSMINNFK